MFMKYVRKDFTYAGVRYLLYLPYDLGRLRSGNPVAYDFLRGLFECACDEEGVIIIPSVISVSEGGDFEDVITFLRQIRFDYLPEDGKAYFNIHPFERIAGEPRSFQDAGWEQSEAVYMWLCDAFQEQ